MSSMMPDVKEVLIPSFEIQAKVRELGERITEDYRGERPLLVGVLRGAVIVLGDLMRNIDLPCEIDFMDISSYGTGTSSSGVVRILKDPRSNGEHRVPGQEAARHGGGGRAERERRRRVRRTAPRRLRHPRGLAGVGCADP